MQEDRLDSSLIIANGNIDSIFLKKIYSNYSIIIAADGASDFLKTLNLVPSIMIGDFDSINPLTLEYYKKLGVEIVTLNPTKDYTDTHVCVKYAMDKGYKKIDVIGGLGGRWDHSLSNINMLYFAHKQDVKLRIISSSNIVEIYGEGDYKIECKENFYWSIISIFEDSLVSVEDMKYEVENLVIKRGESIGISNEFLQKDGRLVVKRGSVLVVCSKKD